MGEFEKTPPSPLAEGEVAGDETEPSAEVLLPSLPFSALRRGGMRDQLESAGVGIERGAQAVSSDCSTAGGAEGMIGLGVEDVGGGRSGCCGAGVEAEVEEAGFGGVAAAVVAVSVSAAACPPALGLGSPAARLQGAHVCAMSRRMLPLKVCTSVLHPLLC